MTAFEIYWFYSLIPSVRVISIILIVVSIIILFFLCGHHCIDCKGVLTNFTKVVGAVISLVFFTAILLLVVLPNKETIELMVKAMSTI